MNNNCSKLTTQDKRCYRLRTVYARLITSHSKPISLSLYQERRDNICQPSCTIRQHLGKLIREKSENYLEYLKISTQIEQLCSLSNYRAKTKIHNWISSNCILNLLKINNQLLIPAGCLGHAVLLQFEREKPEMNCVNRTYTVRCFNSGDGIKYHAFFIKKGHADKNFYKYNTATAIKNIPYSKLINAIPLILSARSQNSISNLYKILQGLGNIYPEMNYFQSGQKGPNCTYKSINTFLRYALSDKAYTYFMMRLFDSIDQQIQRKMPNRHSDSLEENTKLSIKLKATKRKSKAKVAENKHKFLKEWKTKCNLIQGSVQEHPDFLNFKDVSCYMDFHQKNDLVYHEKETNRIYRVKKTNPFSQTCKWSLIHFNDNGQYFIDTQELVAPLPVLFHQQRLA